MSFSPFRADILRSGKHERSCGNRVIGVGQGHVGVRNVARHKADKVVCRHNHNVFVKKGHKLLDVVVVHRHGCRLIAV